MPGHTAPKATVQTQKDELATESAENRTQTLVATTTWCFCSVGMMVFNKQAIAVFPASCSLVALQMLFTVLFLLMFMPHTLHVGSWRDLLLWCRVAPLFAGVLLTSMLALKHAPMSLVVVFRGAAPLFSIAAERFYPNPLKVTAPTVVSIVAMVLGMAVYSQGTDISNFKGIGWVMLNNFFVITDKLLQRLMLGKDQHPVDISRSMATLVNNLLGMLPIFFVAVYTKEYEIVKSSVAALTTMDSICIFASCVVGTAIAYTGIWVQSLITATSFLVLATANKYAIIVIEVIVPSTAMLTSRPIFKWGQVIGAFITITAGVCYGKAREGAEAAALEKEASLLSECSSPLSARAQEAGESRPLLAGVDGKPVSPLRYDASKELVMAKPV